MPVQIGAKAHSFADPTGLLSDCHRRIEMFLASLQRVAGVIDRPLTDDGRAALESALRYFRESAPKHTADEEESLFLGSARFNPDIEKAITTLEAFENDHRKTDALHAEVDALGIQCLDQLKVFLLKPLHQEFDGSCLHRARGHTDVEVCSNKDDGNRNVGFCKLLLEFQAANAGKPNVEY